MTFTLLKLKQAEINFQQEKIESLEKEISGKFEPKLQEASGQATERKPFDEMTEGQGAGKNNIVTFLCPFRVGGRRKVNYGRGFGR